MKKIVLIGVGKKNLMSEILKKNQQLKEEELKRILTSPKEDRKNKIMTEASKMIETNPNPFID